MRRLLAWLLGTVTPRCPAHPGLACLSAREATVLARRHIEDRPDQPFTMRGCRTCDHMHLIPGLD